MEAGVCPLSPSCVRRTLLASAIALSSTAVQGAPEDLTTSCIQDNEAAQEAAIAKDFERSLNLALACSAPQCPSVVREHCEKIAIHARNELREREPVTPSASAEPAVAPASAPPPRDDPATEAPSRVPSYVLGSVAIAATASFGFFALRGRGMENDLTCGTRCSDRQLDPISTSYLVADISLGVGVLALAGSLYFWPWGSEGSKGSMSLSASPRDVRFGVAF